MLEFEWDNLKSAINYAKHGVDFYDAQLAFLDRRHVIMEDLKHSENEKRYFCYGRVEGEILTVRFTKRNGRIRIIGAGFWRKGKIVYENQN